MPVCVIDKEKSIGMAHAFTMQSARKPSTTMIQSNTSQNAQYKPKNAPKCDMQPLILDSTGSHGINK